MRQSTLLLATIFASFLCADYGMAMAVRGTGGASCGSWTREHKQDSILAAGDDLWLMGYITSYNRWAYKGGPDIANGTDVAGLVAAVSQYCEAHPLDYVETAAENLITQLIARDEASHLNDARP